MDMTDPSFDRTDAHARAPRRRGLFGFLILPLLAFLLGLAAMAWLLTRWDAGARYLGLKDAAPPAAVVTTTPSAQPQAPGGTLVLDPEVTRRVALLEQRVADIANQSQAAIGNADRAEGLLVAFAARRALDRGVALGYIEGLLHQRFGQDQPQAVGTIIAAAREPVTLQELQEGLQKIGPSLVGRGTDENWWTSVRTELASLITVRKAGSPSTIPAERLIRAEQRLEAGQVDVALAEVLRMPGRGTAVNWIADARRYVAARRALDTIETAALLAPQMSAPQPEAARPAAMLPGGA